MLQKVLTTIPILAWVVLGGFIGYLARGSAVELSMYASTTAHRDLQTVPPVWICPSHPEVRGPGKADCPRCDKELIPAAPAASPSTTRTAMYACSMFCLPPQRKAGLCPACGMEMVEVGSDEPGGNWGGGASTLTLSPRAQRLASIMVARVERKFVSTEIRMVGQVDYDEYNKARNRPYRVGKTGRSVGKAVARMGVTLEAYEPDLAWLRLGQSVTIESDVCAGEIFHGKIVFIDGKLDSFTRTVEVRVRVPDLDERLKLQTLVRATVSAVLNSRGEAIAPEVSGTWLCPMHADVAKDEFGKCDVCGIDLREAETLGYRPTETGDATAPLVIPGTAPLITGKRAVVYVAVPGSPGTYEGRTIVLGPRAGDYYVVREGLEEGENVVVNGNFKIDSALQILARRSMMSPDVMRSDRGSGPVHLERNDGAPTTELIVPAEFQRDVDRMLSDYYEVQLALSHDNLGAARTAAGKLRTTVGDVRTILLHKPAGRVWASERASLQKEAARLANASDLNVARNAFEPISATILAIFSQFGGGGTQPVHRFYCPMAFDNRGAYWLQAGDQLRNPYFGSAMLRCGKLTETFSLKPPTASHGDRDAE